MAGGQGDPRVTVGASPTRQPPRATPPSQTLQAVELPAEFDGTSHQSPSISLGALADDQMSITASLGGLASSGDEDYGCFASFWDASVARV